METKFAICQEVSYFNDSTQKVEHNPVQGIKIIATGVHADEEGKDILDSFVVLYTLKNGVNVTENACFASDEECKQYYASLFATL